jgi:DHA1 family bicyclomycin/chloramphenicol resistance-like MFS transporter
VAKRVIIMGMTTASAPTRRRLSTGLSPGMLVVLGALSAFGPLSTDMYLPGLPAMARDLGVSPSTAQLTLSGCLIGLAIGQLIAGPLSDALGRRKPLLLGLVAYVLASTLCAVSPGIAVLLAARFVQGLAGAAGIAIARAIVRDRSEGVAAARAYAMLMVVTGLGPIVAPIAGGLLLHVTDWRGIFVALAGIGALILVGAAVLIPETLSPEARHSGGLPTTRTAIGILLHDRRYVGHTLACALAFGTLMAYISASPFVLEQIHRLSAQSFSLVFAANGCAILVARQIGASNVGRLGPTAIMRGGLICQLTAATGVLLFTLFDPSLVPLLICLFVAVGSVGAIMPMATALAMQDHPERAGSASGLLGFTQFTLGSAVAPLVGIAGAGSAIPMAVAMPACSLAAFIALRSAERAAHSGR